MRKLKLQEYCLGVSQRRNSMETRDILNKLEQGEITVEEAEGYFRKQPIEELGYAKLDMHRKLRSGFAEVIFCSGKADEHLLNIFGKLYEADGEVLAKVVNNVNNKRSLQYAF